MRHIVHILVDDRPDDRPVASLAVEPGGLTLGSGADADLLLPLCEEAWLIAMTPAGDKLAYRVLEGPELPDCDSSGAGILADEQTLTLPPYKLRAQCRRSPTSRLSPLDRATVVFDAGRGTIERTTASVTVLDGPDQGRSKPLDASHLTIGTDPACDLVLTDNYVSGRHATLIARGDGFFLRDDGSTNGVFVGGARVAEATLAAGGIFRIGKTEIRVDATVEAESIEATDRTEYFGMIGAGAAMRRIFALMDKAAPSGATILLRGPTGSGKELAARAIHRRSDRDDGPFIAVNCGAIPPELMESELFGHVRGAFSGAHRDRRGLFELAHGGTLFLDEVAELPMSLQPKLLRILEEGTFRKVGGEQEIRVDVRVVAATNRNLRELVDGTQFREDLYFRLAMIAIALPPLAERVEDITLLAKSFLAREAKDLGIKPAPKLTGPARGKLKAHSWPGNVRELRNAIRRALILGSGATTLDEDAFALEDPDGTLRSGTLAELEKKAILQALATSPSRMQAARRLGIAISTLYKKMKKFGLE